MGDQNQHEHSPRGGAATFQSLPADSEPVLHLHHQQVQPKGDAAVYPGLRENSLAAGDHRHARVALLCEAGDRPRMETPAAPECRYELGSDDLFLEQEDEDSDDYDDGAALSLRGVSPPESVLMDEELLVDHVEDFNGQLKSAETEGAAAVPQK